MEVDASISSDLQRHLKMYKIRKKIDIIPIQTMNVWSSFDTDFDAKSFEKSKFNVAEKSTDDVMIFKDPRIPTLGLRILTNDSVSREEILEKVGIEVWTMSKYICNRPNSFKI